MNRFISFLVCMCSLSMSCQDSGKLTVIADMPSSLKENSGLAYFGKNHVWTVEDSGNNDDLYALDFKGNIIKVLDVKDVNNEDWEDLAVDQSNNLYIGDFGDNNHDRENLIIYKLPNPENEKGDKIEAQRIEFNYEDGLHYNTEAFFHWNGSLYLITKNLENKKPVAKIFTLPDTAGKYRAKYLGELSLCNDYSHCAITSADISSDGEQMILLGDGFLWTITNYSSDDFLRGRITKHDLGLRTQLEAACFFNETTLLLSDEKNHSEGGNLYLLDLTKL